MMLSFHGMSIDLVGLRLCPGTHSAFLSGRALQAKTGGSRHAVFQERLSAIADPLREDIW